MAKFLKGAYAPPKEPKTEPSKALINLSPGIPKSEKPSREIRRGYVSMEKAEAKGAPT